MESEGPEKPILNASERVYAAAGLSLKKVAEYQSLVIEKASCRLKKGNLKADGLALIRLANEAVRERNLMCGGRASGKQNVKHSGTVIFDCSPRHGGDKPE
jgi:hypothetical protein